MFNTIRVQKEFGLSTKKVLDMPAARFDVLLWYLNKVEEIKEKQMESNKDKGSSPGVKTLK